MKRLKAENKKKFDVNINKNETILRTKNINRKEVSLKEIRNEKDEGRNKENEE